MEGTSRSARMFAGALVVWLALGAVQALIALGLGNGRVPWWIVLVIHAAHSVFWAAFTLAIAWWSQLVSRQPRAVVIVSHILAVVVAALIDTVVRRASTQLLIGGSMVSFARTTLYYADLTTLSYILALWLGKVLDAREGLVAHAKHELALRSQLARARLAYLHAQLQPHFLFNALGAVSELIFENPAAAVRTFRQLGTVLRAAASRDTTEIPLREEVEGLLPYLELQRTRFSDWLAIELDLDDDAGDVLVPPLVLQPLVENSIRHGLRGRSSRGEVTITASVADGRLLLSVRDNGVGLDAGHVVMRSGVGLSNTQERLRTLYGDDARLKLFNDVFGGAVAEISIPARIERPKPADMDTVLPPEARSDHGMGFARRHPVLSLMGGALVAGALWSQQSYSYLLMSGRLGERTFLDLVRDDFVLVSAWTAMVPIIVWMSRRFPVAEEGWIATSLLHLGASALLNATHGLAVFIYRSGGEGTGFLAAFRGSAPITFLLYIGVLAYGQRRVLEEWLAEKQLAAMKINAEITEANIAAATMSVPEKALEGTLAELERYASDDPLRAELAIAQLGSELRERLEKGFGAGSGGSGSRGALTREDGVESLAMRA